MNKILLFFLLSSALILSGCFGGSDDVLPSKLDFKSGRASSYKGDRGPRRGFGIDEPAIETRPKEVLMTPYAEHRLLPIFKINYDTTDKTRFSGSISFHEYNGSYRSSDFYDTGKVNNWNGNFMPGFEAIYGFNFLNLAYFNPISRERHNLFPNHVLIKTLYYPTVSKDTLDGQPILRDFYMVTVYDDDTNEDGWVDWKDLRRMYAFGLDGKGKQALVPSNYSVMSSEYDPLIDHMYIYAKLDENENGKMELFEPTHVFWIDLAESSNWGRMY